MFMRVSRSTVISVVVVSGKQEEAAYPVLAERTASELQ